MLAPPFSVVSSSIDLPSESKCDSRGGLREERSHMLQEWIFWVHKWRQGGLSTQRLAFVGLFGIWAWVGDWNVGGVIWDRESGLGEELAVFSVGGGR